MLQIVRIVYGRDMSDPKESRYLAQFGKTLADIRKQRGLTQEGLAEKAGITSLSLSFIEQGRRWPRIATTVRIAKCLDVPVAKLFEKI